MALYWSRRGRLLAVGLALTGLLLTAISDSVGAGDTLQAFRANVRTAPPAPVAEKPQKPPRKPDRQRWCDCNDNYDDAAEEVLGNFLGAMFAPAIVASFFAAAGVATAPFWGPAQLVHDDYVYSGQFAAYPYADPIDGYLLIDSTPQPFTYPWSLHVRTEYADDFDDMSIWSGNLLFEATNRLGIDTSADYRREALGRGTHDHLWTGDFNLVFRFAQSQRLALRSGIGAAWLSDTDNTNIGFNFTYGGDWFPRRPWVVSSIIDLGRIGHATLFHGRATIGVNYRHWEIYSGFDYYGLGGAHSSSIVTGVGFWY